MKKTTLFLLLFCTLLLLTSCTKEKISDIVSTESESLLETQVETESVPETIIETETQPEAPLETQPETQEEPETQQETIKETEKVPETQQETEDNAYIVRIERANFPIYDGPSYDNFQVGTIGTAGAFTIVDQVQDDEGNHWGKLKSGAGWVDLSLIEQEKNSELVVTASWMDTSVLGDQKFYYCDADESPFAKPIVFYTNQTLTDVSFFSLFMNEFFEKGEEYYHMDTWEADALFVADVYFAGDFTMYGLSFKDSSGTEHIYYATESGRNGSISFIPFEFELVTP